LHKSRME